MAKFCKWKINSKIAALRDPFGSATAIGEIVAVAVGAQTVNMIYANNLSSITFPHGVADATTQTLTRKMFMQETDLTNAQAVEILQWAYGQGKFSATVGDHNGLSSATVKWGGQELVDLDAGDGDYGVGSCWERAADQYLEIGVDASSNACTPGAWDVGFRMARTQ